MVYPVSMTFVEIIILGVGLSSLDIYYGSFSSDLELIDTTCISDYFTIVDAFSFFSNIVACFYFEMKTSILFGLSIYNSAIAAEITFFYYFGLSTKDP